MSTPTKTIEIGQVVIVEGVMPEVSMEAEKISSEVVEIPKFPWSPRPRPTQTQEGMKGKKGKQVAFT